MDKATEFFIISLALVVIVFIQALAIQRLKDRTDKLNSVLKEYRGAFEYIKEKLKGGV